MPDEAVYHTNHHQPKQETVLIGAPFVATVELSPKVSDTTYSRVHTSSYRWMVGWQVGHAAALQSVASIRLFNSIRLIQPHTAKERSSKKEGGG
jgi:hypothetical protein